MGDYHGICLTHAEFVRYYEGGYSKEDEIAIECHFDECDFCLEIFIKFVRQMERRLDYQKRNERYVIRRNPDEMTRDPGFRLSAISVAEECIDDWEESTNEKRIQRRNARCKSVFKFLVAASIAYLIYFCSHDFPHRAELDLKLIAARHPVDVVAEATDSHVFVMAPTHAVLDLAEMPAFPCRVRFDLSMRDAAYCGLTWDYNESEGNASFLCAMLRKTRGGGRGQQIEATLAKCQLVRKEKLVKARHYSPLITSSCGFARPDESVRMEIEFRKAGVTIFVNGNKKIEQSYLEIELEGHSLVDCKRLGIVVDTGSAELSNIAFTKIH